MNVVLWIAAGLLALAFLGAGVTKTTRSKAKLLENPQMGSGDHRGAAGAGGVRGLGTVRAVLVLATSDPRRPGSFRATMNPSVRVLIGERRQ
jgi:hypothetical protein